MTCCQKHVVECACSIPEALKEIWASDDDLQAIIPATDDESTNRFAEEGIIHGDPKPEYAYLESIGELATTLLTNGRSGIARFRLFVFTRSKASLNTIIQRIPCVYRLATGHTQEGSLCKITVGKPTRETDGDGMRLAVFSINVTYSERLALCTF